MEVLGGAKIRSVKSTKCPAAVGKIKEEMEIDK